MSWFSEDAQDASQDTPPVEAGGEPSPSVETPQEGTGDASGRPAWMPESFWVAPAEGGTADYAAMAEKMAGALKESRTKIGEQGEALARHTVPEAVAPYFEGLDKAALASANARSGLDEAQIDQFMAQARSAGIGPGPAQAMLASWMKSRHEATPEAKGGDVLRDEAIAELNAQGRPGSEMARRVRTWGAGLAREQKLSERQLEAIETLTHTAAGLEALHAIMGERPAPVGAGVNDTAGKTILDELERAMEDERFGTDPAYTSALEARLKQHESLFERRYGSISRAA